MGVSSSQTTTPTPRSLRTLGMLLSHDGPSASAMAPAREPALAPVAERDGVTVAVALARRSGGAGARTGPLRRTTEVVCLVPELLKLPAAPLQKPPAPPSACLLLGLAGRDHPGQPFGTYLPPDRSDSQGGRPPNCPNAASYPAIPTFGEPGAVNGTFPP